MSDRLTSVLRAHGLELGHDKRQARKASEMTETKGSYSPDPVHAEQKVMTVNEGCRLIVGLSNNIQ